MSVVVFSDLDDTLVYSERKVPKSINATKISNGSTSKKKSFITIHQHKLLSLFNEHIFIPVTGRNTEALNNLNFEFDGYKIINHGAMILDSNNNIAPDSKHILNKSHKRYESTLNEYTKVVDKISSHENDLRYRMIYDREYFCYLSIKGDPNILNHLVNLFDNDGTKKDKIQIHLNDRNLALLPPYASKLNSVNILQNIYLNKDPDTLFLGIGDSLTDIPFMNNCHFKIIPSNSQVSKKLVD